MTVAELIEELQTMEQSAKVLFACDYGDIGHTRQALAVVGIDEYDTAELEESGYSQSGIALKKREAEAEEGTAENGQAVVVLS